MSVEMKDKLSKRRLFEMVSHRQLSSEGAFRLLKDLQSRRRPPRRFPGNPEEPPPRKDAAQKTGLPGKLGRDLVKTAAQILNVHEKDLSLDGDLQGYGFESITLTAFADKVNETFDLELMPTVFFELDPPTLNGLAGYLSRHYRDRLIRYYGESLKEFSPAEPIATGTVPGKKEQGNGTGTGEPIAIIGMSGVLPRSENLEIFWRHLEAGEDLVGEVPPDRWDWRPHGSDSGARWGGFIKDVDKFDAEFFNISPREARLMDPQQRIFLEIVWKTVEDAGYNPTDLSGTRTGLFVGVSTPDYQSILFSGAVPLDSHMATSLSCAMVANRVSYLLNLHGPSEPIDTACSSSLAAVHRGVEAIWNGTCSQAIAGGVNVMISPGISLAFYSAGMLARDGRCKTFDEKADGYVRGEGAGAVLLKPLHRAVADNDHIYGVIKSTAENHGGHAHSLTAPNANAQAALLVEAYKRAQIDPRTVTYIETHGTGTELGDPVEINGLKKAFDQLYQQQGIPPSAKPFCALGSVKTNIGHLETAAGIAGLIKVLLAMKYKKIPMNLHFRELNPYFELDGTPFFVIHKTNHWEQLSDDKNQPVPRRAGISSFGFGGSNVHVVLEEWPGDSKDSGQTTNRTEQPQGKTYLFVFSAKNTPRLNVYIEETILFLERAFPSLTASSTDRDRARHIREEILSTASRILKVNKSDIYPDEVLEDWGFDQVTLSILAARLEEKYQRGINLETLYQYPSIHALALYLGGEKPTSPDNREIPSTEVSLADIAYTLQVGREPMEERLAVVASTAAQLWEKLNRYYHDNSENINIEGVYRGNAHSRKQDTSSPDMKTVVQNKDLEKIARLYVAAVNIDWRLLYPGNRPKRISLPTYPFERKRHWVENAPGTRENQLWKKKESEMNQESTGCKPSKIQLAMKNKQKQDIPVETAAQIDPPGRKVALKETSTMPAASGAVSSRFPGPPPHVQPGLDAGPGSPARSGKSALVPGIKEILAAVLFKDPAEVNENKAFIEMGLDSILAVEFAKRLEQTFRVEMKATRLYDYSTVRQLARYLSTMVPGQSPPDPAPAKPGESPVSTALPADAGSGDNTGHSDNDVHPARRIKEILASVLFMDPEKIDGNKTFIELGLDSILAVEFTKKLKEAFHLDIKATKLYDYPTVQNLEKYIRSLGPAAPAAEPPSPVEAVRPVRRVPYENGPADGGKPFDRQLSRAKTSPGMDIKTTDVAIIGISARFPGADNIWEYWENLAGAVDSVTEAPPDRWDVNRYYEPDTTDPTKTYCKWGGFLRDIDKFDPLFFNISPAEAELLDPQQRLFLQECWRALEDAGYSASRLDNINCGIYAGVMGGTEYPSSSMLNDRSILAARLSYFLNLKGPAVSIDTACSSSLVAMHLACKSLIDGETEMMLAGGITLYLTEKAFVGMSRMGGIISREGKCKTFDNNADGFVPGEGAAVVVLKLLEKAAVDGDHIYGVIKGSGINQDGKTNGITAPSAESQKNLELKVYKKFDINPETISYVEAHGTGTKLGDPIEIDALTAAFGQYTAKKQFCPIGSVKTNIGHTSAAAGAAGVIKVLLSMKHQKIPPSLHFHQENEHIDFKNSPFFVNTKLSDWNKPPDFPGRAAISSFGYSGTNAHIIIEEPSRQARRLPEDSRPFYFMPLSARTEEILEQKFKDLLHWLDRENESFSLTDIAYTLSAGRSHFNLRAAIVVKDLPDLKQALMMLAQRKKPGNYFINKVNKTADREETQILEKGINLLKELTTDPPLPASEYKNKLTALAHLYTGGYDPDWTLFYQGEGHRRISMPTYPFARERYWISADNAPPGVRAPVGKTGEFTVREGKKTGKKPLSTPLDETGIKKQLENDLTRFIKEILKVKAKDIDPNGSLMEYGFDSISFMQYMKRINQTYDIEFTVESFFDLHRPTVTMLSECLYDRFTDRFTRYFSTDPAGAESVENRETREEGASGPVPGEPIAIIGVSCVMPQSDHPEAFRRNLEEGKNLFTRFPQTRWQQLKISEELTEVGPWQGGFLDQVDAFDAAFFDISPREARMMDPQQRIFLETVWKTVEDAGYKASDLAGTRTGVFVGVSYSHYDSLVKNVKGANDGKKHGILALNAPFLVANRVSYYLNLNGPSEAVDTASSSSLTALHRAVEALRNKSCAMAAVGGVHVILNPDYFHYHDHDPGERPGIFAIQANAYVPGEGAGAVLLKPLKKAIAHQDHIYAVIKGTAENYTVSNNSLLTPVNSTLADLFIEAHENSQIDPGTISYIEAHDIAGDPDNGESVEINALKTAFTLSGKGDDAKSLTPGTENLSEPYCGIGSVKTNIGDLKAAAGIAGLIKVVLAMEHKKIPLTYSETGMNPRENLPGPPFYIVTETGPWECRKDEMHREIPRRAGVSSFGSGGTNVYALLEESPGRKEEKPDHTGPYSGPYLVILSAKSEERLKTYAAELKDFLETNDGQPVETRETTPGTGNLRQKIEGDILQISNETLKVNPEGYEPSTIDAFIRRINETFNLEITGEMFNERPSIGAFIKYLARNYKEQFRGYYNRDRVSDPSARFIHNLADIAYTLQIGREAMPVRLAMVVSTLPQLIEKLDAYCRGKIDRENFYTGNINNAGGQSMLLIEGEEKEVLLRSIIKNRKWTKLGYCWVMGVEIDWNLLYPDERPKRISLPTYPFERKKYWWSPKTAERSKPMKKTNKFNSIQEVIDE